MPPEAPAEPDQPQQQPDAPAQDQASEQPESTFTDFDASQLPENADRGWLESRYQQMQADYTRKTQEIAEQREVAEQHEEIIEAASDPEHPQHEAALDWLGLDPVDAEEGEPDPADLEYLEDELDPREIAELRERMGEIEQEREVERETAELAAYEEAEEEFVAQEIATLQGEVNYDFSDDDLEILYETATSPRFRHQNGQPDVEAAYAALEGSWTARQKAWGARKIGPRQPGGGRAAQRARDLSNERERDEFAVEVAEGAIHARDQQ